MVDVFWAFHLSLVAGLEKSRPCPRRCHAPYAIMGCWTEQNANAALLLQPCLYSCRSVTKHADVGGQASLNRDYFLGVA